MISDVGFPNYAREQKRNVKISLEEIEQMRSDANTGKYSNAQLAMMYSISSTQVRYWLVSDEKRAEMNKARAKRKKTYNPVVHRRYLDRKLEDTPVEIKLYRRSVKDRLKRENPQHYRAKDAEYHRTMRAAKKLAV